MSRWWKANLSALLWPYEPPTYAETNSRKQAKNTHAFVSSEAKRSGNALSVSLLCSLMCFLSTPEKHSVWLIRCSTWVQRIRRWNPKKCGHSWVLTGSELQKYMMGTCQPNWPAIFWLPYKVTRFELKKILIGLLRHVLRSTLLAL